MAEREWREASDMRASVGNLAIVMAVAVALRFWALGHGIPYAVGSDEPVLMERVVAMMKAGDFNPHFFEYGGLLFYLYLPVVVGQFLLGAIAGQWAALDQVGPSDFYLGARALTALVGAATVFLLYQIGLRWGARHALLGAGLLAVMPLHVRESHYVHADALATFFIALTMLLSLVAHEKATSRAFLWAGVAAGLGAATTYGTAIVLVVPIVAAWMTLHARPSRPICLLSVIGGAFVTFLVVAPYTLLDLPGFLNGVSRLAHSYNVASPAGEPAWLATLQHLRLTLGWPAMLLLLAGFVLSVVRAIKGPGRVRWTLLVTFPVVQVAMLTDRAAVVDRDVIPLLPFVCLIAALAVVSGVSLLRRFDIPRAPRRLLIAALTVAALLPPLVQSVSFDRQISLQSTQATAYRWITSNLPDGTRIVVERAELRLPSRYRTEFVSRLADRSYEEYVRTDTQYLLATSRAYGPAFDAPQQHRALYGAYRQLFDQAQEVLVIKPDARRPGPELRVYKLRVSAPVTEER